MESVNVEKVSLSHRKIFTDIEIDASPEEVWAALTDTATYKNWAAFLVDVDGEIADGNVITTAFQMNPKKEKLNTIKHRITVEDGTRFHWSDKFPGGILDNHHFRVEPIENGRTRFVQTVEFSGGLTWLMGGSLTKTCAAGYQAFNRALKQEAERRSNGH